MVRKRGMCLLLILYLSTFPDLGESIGIPTTKTKEKGQTVVDNGFTQVINTWMEAMNSPMGGSNIRNERLQQISETSQHQTINFKRIKND